jgi:hypothetical protein
VLNRYQSADTPAGLMIGASERNADHIQNAALGLMASGIRRMIERKPRDPIGDRWGNGLIRHI